MIAETLQRRTSRNGQATLEVDGLPYHSIHDPAREAERFYSGLELEKADIVFHFGWGLGYAAPILRKRLPRTARAVIFEPDPALFDLAQSEPGTRTARNDSRFDFVVGIDKACRFFDDWSRLNCHETDRILWIEWPAARRRHEDLATSLEAQFKAHLRDRAANLLTHIRNGGNYFKNVMANLAFQADADAGRLFGRFQNIPLVIVSAGPSLDRNIHELRDAGSRCFILSVDTALRPLLAAGITPHAVITADPSELNGQHVAGAMPESTVLIAEQAVHPAALEAAKKRFLFGLGLFPDSLFAKFGFQKAAVDAWGSVATCALDFACRLGANPIVFAGQDLAYSWNREYASHTIYQHNWFDIEQSGTAKAPDLYGNPAFTTPNLIAYRDYFVRRMRQSPGVRFINGTEGGILTEGCEILPLKEALRQTAIRDIDIRGVLDRCWRPSRLDVRALDHLEQTLKSRRTNCGCLAGFLELTAKQHLLGKNDAGIEDSIRMGLQTLTEVRAPRGTRASRPRTPIPKTGSAGETPTPPGRNSLTP